MSLALVDHEGRVLTNDKPTPPPATEVELSLDQRAALEAAKQSTKRKEEK